MAERKKDSTGESMFLGMSLRGAIALLIVFTVCVMSCVDKKIVEPLYSLAMIIVGFFFAQKSKSQGSQKDDGESDKT